MEKFRPQFPIYLVAQRTRNQDTGRERMEVMPMSPITVGNQEFRCLSLYRDHVEVRTLFDRLAKEQCPIPMNGWEADHPKALLRFLEDMVDDYPDLYIAIGTPDTLEQFQNAWPIWTAIEHLHEMIEEPT